MTSGVGVKGLQFLPQKKISKDNSIESLQLLYDILGAQKLGRDGDDVYVCGVKLTGGESLSITEILNRLKAELGDLTGEQGEDGQAAAIEIGNTQTLPAGNPATVSNSGTAQNAVLNFGIPQGPAGATGPQGPAGPAGTWVNGSATATNPDWSFFLRSLKYNATQKIAMVSGQMTQNTYNPSNPIARLSVAPADQMYFVGTVLSGVYDCEASRVFSIDSSGYLITTGGGEPPVQGTYFFSVSFVMP
jgi:hypothetical protein